jgi:hypothetical protein
MWGVEWHDDEWPFRFNGLFLIEAGPAKVSTLRYRVVIGWRGRARADVIDLPSKAHGRSIRVSSERVPYHSSLSGRASSRTTTTTTTTMQPYKPNDLLLFSSSLFGGWPPHQLFSSILRNWGNYKGESTGRNGDPFLFVWSRPFIQLQSGCVLQHPAGIKSKRKGI